jgi:hypothetical protein
METILETQQSERESSEPFFEFFEKLRNTIRSLLFDAQKPREEFANYDGDGEGAKGEVTAGWSAAKKRSAQLRTSSMKREGREERGGRRGRRKRRRIILYRR